MTQCVRPDGVPLVLGQIHAGLALAGEYVEVVEPEVDHQLFELPIAVDGADQLLLREIGKHFALRLHCLHLFGRAPLAPRGRVHLWSSLGGGAGGLLRPAPLHHRRHEVSARQIRGAHRQRRERREPPRDAGIGQTLGVKLHAEAM